MSPVPMMICSYANKRAYLSQVEAEGVAAMIVERDPDGPRYVYACDHCEGWHLTRMEPAQPPPTPPPERQPAPPPRKPASRKPTPAYLAQEAALVAQIRKARARCKAVQGLPQQYSVGVELAALRRELRALRERELALPVAAE
jgi:hypothetical protein